MKASGKPMDTLREKRMLEEMWGHRPGALEISMTRSLPNRDFWRDKRVFLTGAYWVQRILASDVAAPPGGRMSLALPCRQRRAAYMLMPGVSRIVRSLTGDIRDREALRAALHKARPHVVLHLAAQALVRQSYQQPIETFATNAMGTAHLLEAACAVPDVRGDSSGDHRQGL